MQHALEPQLFNQNSTEQFSLISSAKPSDRETSKQEPVLACEDNLVFMEKIPDAHMKLVVTSPPYNLADRGMYFILRLTQLIVRPDSRLGLLRYKIAPKCLLPGPFRHSGVGRNPGAVGPVRSYNLVFTYPCQLQSGEALRGQNFTRCIPSSAGTCNQGVRPDSPSGRIDLLAGRQLRRQWSNRTFGYGPLPGIPRPWPQTP